ncbi:MAG: hypothetical protein IPG04_40045 [Polyangiaceae bacterium]|nr:hypothetical protein [Polyangiaceae bacterium]
MGVQADFSLDGLCWEKRDGTDPGREIHRLKRDVSLERVGANAGIALMKTGANLVGLCPFHDDREPSLVITRREQPVALPRGVPGGRERDRLRDARGG